MPLSAADTAHLIRRTGFGVTGQLFGELRGMTRRAAVERMLDRSRAEPDVLEPPSLLGPPTYAYDLPVMRRLWLDRMARTQAPLVEKMTLFWHGHFVSATDKVANLDLLRMQNMTQRRLAMGGFVDLLQAMCVDPAMLLYLDNWRNVAGSPEENFGREVLEVFTVGPVNRTEGDVVAMTRAWTGHGLNTPLLNNVGFEDPGTTYEFHPGQHDAGQKQLFGGPPRSWDGPEAVADLVTRAKRTEVSRFIAAKLFSFVGYPIAPASPTAGRLGEVFSRSGLDITELLRAILLSDEFWSPAARLAVVRSPVEWVVAALQATGQSALVAMPDTFMAQMGQELYHPPSVAGWGQNEYWLSTTTTWGKAAFASRLRDLVGNLGVMSDVGRQAPREAVTRAFAHFGVTSPSRASRSVAEAMVSRLQMAGHEERVPALLTHLMLLTPEFQLA